LYRNGVDVLSVLLKELQFWLDHSEFNSVEQLKGCLSQARLPDPGVFERANYMKALTAFTSGANGHSG
jgi:dihydroorotate dehydrogenase (fumarate)